MFKDILGVTMGSFAAVGLCVLIPAAFSSGNGKVVIGLAILWLIIRIFFGKDEADKLLKHESKPAVLKRESKSR